MPPEATARVRVSLLRPASLPEHSMPGWWSAPDISFFEVFAFTLRCSECSPKGIQIV